MYVLLSETAGRRQLISQAFSKFGAVGHSSVDGGPKKALSALLWDVHRCFASVAGLQPVLAIAKHF